MSDWIHVYAAPGDKYALLRGNLGGWLRRRGIPAYRTNVWNGWWKRQDGLQDVMAAMQQDGLHVSFSTARPPRHVPPPFLPAVVEDERRSA